ncbi:MAG: indolepyruvate oxidoreductase subunit beta family protein [Boseongicola sp. SB0677_bin_26]|nr:indolepyruvate oxidoreductase subunit beta family protein [Boseongicola sp. SB0665_bin_10]MYG27214.1 indolepyruvate oxidoreductase subunit beta family protein [Boseongicola sp. SB0677_bin_26]
MTLHQPVPAKEARPGPDDVIKLAIMAVGGQGGGVLTRWIETLARSQGYACQATSVAGVAQRTGATVYYVEMARTGSGQPVFALAPAAGDVDILIAAELMEAGRAIARGFVTPDRTTLIASSHRDLAVSEKTVPGDGIADAAEVRAAAEIAAARFICFDMERLAVESGSVISATLFGTLAASRCLPFERADFEDAIRTGKREVEASLRAFDAGFHACLQGVPSGDAPERSPPAQGATGPAHLLDRWQGLAGRVSDLPAPVRPIAMAGLRKVVDFMDADYGQEYLDRMAPFVDADGVDNDHALTRAAAKYVANAMAYDDVIRVADLKTRASRNDRIVVEMGTEPQQLLHLTEYMHPRAEEIVGLLPARLGARIAASPRAMARVDRWFSKGRRLRSDRLGPFLLLYALGGLKRYRRRTRRHAVEQAHLDRWLSRAARAAADDPALATEVLGCGRLIKGYSDTHARGLSNFDKVLGIVDQVAGRPDAAACTSRLREAALLDEDGKALTEAIRAIERS